MRSTAWAITVAALAGAAVGALLTLGTPDLPTRPALRAEGAPPVAAGPRATPPAQDAPPPAAAADRRTPIVIAVERAGPGVVNVSTERVGVRWDPLYDPFFSGDDPFAQMYRQWFGQQQTFTSTSLGSGAIVDPAGYCVTNAHVVARATQIHVTLSDRRRFDADLVASSPDNDLAVLRLHGAGPFPAVPLGTSADLMVGETAIAVGNPYGLDSTVTTGVISAKNRSVELNGKEAFRDFLQTDAAINPGNSGGPLLNIRGELIGVTTAMRAEAQGIGFAIPADRVRQVVADLLDPTSVRGTWIGIDAIEAPGGDVVVKGVDDRSPAAAAGLRAGDRVLAVDGEAVGGLIAFRRLLTEKDVGAEIRLRLERDRDAVEATIRVREAPPGPGGREIEARIGVRGTDLSPEDAAKRGLRGGVLVTGLTAGGPADKAGVRRGDVVIRVSLAVGARRGPRMIRVFQIASGKDLASVLANVHGGDPIGITISRDGDEFSGQLVTR